MTPIFKDWNTECGTTNGHEWEEAEKTADSVENEYYGCLRWRRIAENPPRSFGPPLRGGERPVSV